MHYSHIANIHKKIYISHKPSISTPKYTLPQRLVQDSKHIFQTDVWRYEGWGKGIRSPPTLPWKESFPLQIHLDFRELRNVDVSLILRPLACADYILHSVLNSTGNSGTSWVSTFQTIWLLFLQYEFPVVDRYRYFSFIDSNVDAS